MSTSGGDPTVLYTLPFEPDFWGRVVDDEHFVVVESGSQGDVWMVENFDPDVAGASR